MNRQFEKSFSDIFGENIPTVADTENKRRELEQQTQTFLNNGGRVNSDEVRCKTVAEVKAKYPTLKDDILSGKRGDHKTMVDGAYVKEGGE